MGRTGHARALLVVLLAAGGCREAEDSLDTLRRAPLPAAARAGTTLGVDSAGLAWIGLPGRLQAVDSAGGAGPAVATGGDSVPRLLWRTGERLVIGLPGRIATAPAAGGDAAAGWRSAGLRTALRDPRGRWVYAVGAGGGIVGLDPDSLLPRWGWPEAGAEARGAAVSPLADRLYLALDTGAARPAALQVRDAANGRVLLDDPSTAPSGLAAGGEGGLFAAAGGTVYRLEPSLGAVRRAWSRPAALDGELELRTDGAGRRVAVFARGEGGGLLLLDGRTGEVLGESGAPPLDAAFGPGGRLYLLEPGSLRVVR